MFLHCHSPIILRYISLGSTRPPRFYYFVKHSLNELFCYCANITANKGKKIYEKKEKSYIDTELRKSLVKWGNNFIYWECEWMKFFLCICSIIPLSILHWLIRMRCEGRAKDVELLTNPADTLCVCLMCLNMRLPIPELSRGSEAQLKHQQHNMCLATPLISYNLP